MILPDINVLIYAHRKDSPDHELYNAWLEKAISNTENMVALTDHVLAGFARIVTHPRLFPDPSPPKEAFAFIDYLIAAPGTIRVSPPPAHWRLFADLCIGQNARGGNLSDIYLATFAMALNAEFISTDRDFEKIPELRWPHPLR